MTDAETRPGDFCSSLDLESTKKDECDQFIPKKPPDMCSYDANDISSSTASCVQQIKQEITDECTEQDGLQVNMTTQATNSYEDSESLPKVGGFFSHPEDAIFVKVLDEMPLNQQAGAVSETVKDISSKTFPMVPIKENFVVNKVESPEKSLDRSPNRCTDAKINALNSDRMHTGEVLITEISPDMYHSDESMSSSCTNKSDLSRESTTPQVRKFDVHCISCDSGFRWMDFYRHRVSIHNDSVPSDHREGEYVCGECPSGENTLTTWCQYLKHVISKHSKQLELDCKSSSINRNEKSIEIITEISPEMYSSDDFDDSSDDDEDDSEDDEYKVSPGKKKKEKSSEDVRCASCNAGFRWMAFYHHRVTTHHDTVQADHKDGEYICGECPAEANTFTSWRQYQKHARNSHSDQAMYTEYPCEICGKVLSTKDTLRDHQNLHINGSDHRCDICEKNFVGPRQLRQHVKKFHGPGSEGSGPVRKGKKPSAPKGPVECPICGRTLGTYMTMKIHMRGHTGERPFTCDICEKTFVCSSSLHKHKRTHLDEKPRVQCLLCGKLLSGDPQLRLHMKLHADDRQFECDVCQAKFVSTTDLKRHRRIHSDSRPYNCGFCGKGFLSKTHMESHMAIHTDEKPYICEICGKRFPDKYRLKGHGYVHNEESGFTCAVCGKTFGSPSRLQRHERCHTKELPAFPCDCCARRFDSALHLKRHQAEHTGDRGEDVIFCKLCDKVFIEPNALKRHSYSCGKTINKPPSPPKRPKLPPGRPRKRPLTSFGTPLTALEGFGEVEQGVLDLSKRLCEREGSCSNDAMNTSTSSCDGAAVNASAGASSVSGDVSASTSGGATNGEPAPVIGRRRTPRKSSQPKSSYNSLDIIVDGKVLDTQKLAELGLVIKGVKS